MAAISDPTPDEYLSNILQHSNGKARTGLVPRDDCAPLGNFFRRHLTFRPTTQILAAEEPFPREVLNFVTIYTFRPGGVVANPFDCDTGIKTQQKQGNQEFSNIIVLRGYPHLRTLCEVGAAYHIDPLIYQRHMHYLTVNEPGGSSPSLYTLPVLPSFCAKTTIFQLNLTTILYDHFPSPPADSLGDVGHMRQGCAEQLGCYHQDLAYCKAAPRDSVVQQYSLLSRSSDDVHQTSTLSAIDQTITIGIIPTPTAWTAVIWTDSARDLQRSLPGPWRQYHHVSVTESVAAAGLTYEHATPPPRDRLGLLQPDGATELLGSGSQTPSTAREGTNLTSGAADFPEDMGKLFSNNSMGSDALFAVSSVLQISAASQRRLLSVLWGLLDAEMDLAGRGPASHAPMANVCYLKTVTDRHIGRLSSTVMILENRDQHDWPRAPPGSPEREEADRAIDMLLRDFSHLKEEAQRLSARLGESIQFLASNAAFLESVKSISNARRVERLALLATIFLPLTFTCSAFGMNFSLFGQGDLSIWIYFPAAAIVVWASFLAWSFSSGDWSIARLRMWISS